MLQITTKVSSLGFLLYLYSTTPFASDAQNIIPIYIEPVTVHGDFYNNINPNWSDNNKTLSFERYNNLAHEIVLFNTDKKKLKFISSQPNKNDELAFLFGAEELRHNFSFDLSWSSDNMRYVFSSNGENENFDLYLGDINSESTSRITFHNAVDNQPRWNPKNDRLVFVSSRHGKASLYLYDINTQGVISLLTTVHSALNPTWSPDGKKLAFMIGEANSFQIYIIDDIQQPKKTLRQITRLTSNNIRPSWSPDGSKLAFYTQGIKEQYWKISVVQSHSQTALQENKIQDTIVSTKVIQNSASGPSWLPDNKHIAYIKYINEYDNPIHIVNVKNKLQRRVITNTKINRDVVCSNNGKLAFQNQDQQWSQIFIAKLPKLEMARNSG